MLAIQDSSFFFQLGLDTWRDQTTISDPRIFKFQIPFTTVPRAHNIDNVPN